MGTRYLYLVRHGNYNSFDKEDPLGGNLTLMGRDQAFYVRKYFERIPVTAIHASSMRRAIETAEIIQEGHPHIEIHPTRMLWECIPVVPNRLADQFYDRFPHLTPERLAQQRSYADRAFAAFFQPPSSDDPLETHDLLVCHGNLIRYLVCLGLGVDTGAWANMLINQCSVTRFAIDHEDGILMQSYNESAHMPEELWVD